MGITLQRQATDECFITAIAMVIGKPVAEVRAEFETMAGGLSYANIRGKRPAMWWIIAGRLLTAYGLSGEAGSTLRVAAFSTPPAGPRRVNLTASMLNGKGMLCVNYTKKYAHAVAFEDGMIFDPVKETPLPFKAWKSCVHSFKSWRIDRIGG